MAWTVRYKFHTSHPFEASEPQLSATLGGRNCKISNPENAPIKDSRWLIFIFDDFASEADATYFGNKFVSALMLTGVVKNIGIDGGEDKSSPIFSEDIIIEIAKIGGTLRPNVHGLSIYEKMGEDVYFNFSASATVSQNYDDFLLTLSDSFSNIGQIGDQEKLALRLLALSKNGTGPLAQSILALSAVEAISRCAPWTEAQLKLIEKIKANAVESEQVSSEEALEVTAALDRTFRNGVLQSIRQKMRALGLSRSDWSKFNDVYTIRSQILHGSRTGSDAYNELWHKTSPICDKIILAAVAQT